MEQELGRMADATGPSQAEPEDVSALRASVPCAITSALHNWSDWLQAGAKCCADEGVADGRNRIVPLPPYLAERLAHVLGDAAQAIEARRAETLGSVEDESAVPQECPQNKDLDHDI